MTKTLVYWTYLSSSPLSKGWIPNGLTNDDFEGGYRTEKGKYIGWYKGTENEAASYGMLPYEEPKPNIYDKANDTITIGGQPAQGQGNTYYSVVGAEVVLQADILDVDGNLATNLDQTELQYPPLLKMPLVKMVGGINGTEVDEIYFNVTLVEGQLTATGVIPSSGDWKLTSDRVNAAIKAIGGDWSVNPFVINFLV